jgi:hypothetical protein
VGADANARTKFARLRAFPEKGSVRVERAGHGVIRGLTITAPGSAKGHGFAIDKLTAQHVVQHGEGMKGRWTHPDMCADGLGHYLGRWANLRMGPGDRAVGDFCFSRAAHQFHPDGLKVSAADYLMARAEEVERGEEKADVLGVSIVAAFELEDREGDEPLARIPTRDRLQAADFVDTPAAGDGLFADGPHALAARGAEHLDFLSAELGEERVVAFLTSWLGRRTHGSENVTLEEAIKKIKVLEEDVAERDAKLATATTQVATVQAQLGAMVAADEARKLGEAKAREAAQDAYVTELATKSAALQAPIEAPKLDLVRRAFKRGDDEGARALGAAYLGEAEAKAKLSGGSGAGKGPTQSLGPAGSTHDPAEDEKQVAQQVVTRLRAAGIKAARLTEDGRGWTTDPLPGSKE